MKRIKGKHNTVIEVRGCLDCPGRCEDSELPEDDFCIFDIQKRFTSRDMGANGRTKWCPMERPLVFRLAASKAAEPTPETKVVGFIGGAK